VQSNQPSPELLTAVGHAFLRSVAIGQGDILRSAAGALERLDKLLPDASPEGRMVAVLMALTDDPTPPLVTSPEPQPTPAPSSRKDATSKADRPTRQSKASNPRMDASGRLLPSREINGIAVVSQAEARKALGVSCVQMLRLEGQKALSRVQESGMRHVFYDVCQVQKLIDLIDRPPTQPL
jgi:hypothetical protein